MPRGVDSLCQAVPGRRGKAGAAATAAGLWLSLGLGCSEGPTAPPQHVSNETVETNPLPSPPFVPELPFPPGPPVPLPCEVMCGPSFTLALPENLTWPAGTYFFRVAKDGNPPQVCSVVLEPVFGASQNNCSPESAGFSVNYRYDSEVQRIASIDFSGTLKHLSVEVLTAENAPHLFDFSDDLVWVRTRSCAGCLEFRASGTGVPEADAGAPPDAGDAGTESDAAPDADAG